MTTPSTDTIQYNTTLKACGDEYKKIVFWNRFIRNPIETILMMIPAAFAITMMCLGTFNMYMGVIYAACFAYPLYIFFIQFNNSVKYHLKHRDPSESAPCTITLMDTGVMADIPDYDIVNTYDWDSFTTAYYRFGYYMFFEGSKMTLMLRNADMNKEQQEAAPEYIKSHVNQNICRITF